MEAIRRRWFPARSSELLHWTCDPAGQARSSHGTQSAVQVLHDFGIYPRVIPDANTPTKRDFAIQTVSGYLARRRPNGSPVCAIDPRFLVLTGSEQRRDPVLVDGFEVGYVWDDDHAYHGTQYANLRRPKKDGWYDHAFNGVEYAVIAFAPPDPAAEVGLFRNRAAVADAERVLRAHGTTADVHAVGEQVVAWRLERERVQAERRALREAQRDPDEEYDEGRSRPRRRRVRF